MLKICCDFCDTVLDEIELTESWELQKHREAGRIACDDCEKTFKEYQTALSQLENKNRQDFETAKAALKERYFGKKADSGNHVKEKKVKKKDREKPPHYFRTIDS